MKKCNEIIKEAKELYGFAAESVKGAFSSQNLKIVLDIVGDVAKRVLAVESPAQIAEKTDVPNPEYIAKINDLIHRHPEFLAQIPPDHRMPVRLPLYLSYLKIDVLHRPAGHYTLTVFDEDYDLSERLPLSNLPFRMGVNTIEEAIEVLELGMKMAK